MHEKQFHDVFVACLYQQLQFLRIGFLCRCTPQMSCCNLFPFTKILWSFMQSPYTDYQCLQFVNFYSVPPKQSLPTVTFTASSDTIPDCGVQHKMLMYDIFNDYHNYSYQSCVIIPYLLQLPVIRLQELAFGLGERSHSIFHQVAHHPNLNVAKLSLTIILEPLAPLEIKESLSTVEQDLERLFQMPTLREFHLSGEWIYHYEVRKAMVNSLQQQVQICSLEKIHLEYWPHYCRYPPPSTHYTESEFKELWSTVFSLPQLDQIVVDLNLDAYKMQYFLDKAPIVCDCWKQLSLTKKLKTLQLHIMAELYDLETGEGERLEPLHEVTRELNIYSWSKNGNKITLVITSFYTEFFICHMPTN